MKKLNTIAKTILLAALVSPFLVSSQSAYSAEQAIGTSTVERDQDKGWYLYNETEAEKEEKKKKSKSETAPKKKPFTTEWFKENLDVYRNKAIDKPTDDNILAYEVLQRIMLERSFHYARRTVEVMQKYPALDGNTYMPGSNTGFSSARIDAEDFTKELLARLKDRVGLWFFFDDSRLSKEQAKTLNMFKKMYPLEVLPIQVGEVSFKDELFPDAERNDALVKQLGVSYYPAIILVDAKTEKFYPLAFNYTTLSMLSQKVLQILKTENLISPADWERSRNGGRISPFMETVYELESGETDIKDVDSLVEKFKKIGRMGNGQ